MDQGLTESSEPATFGRATLNVERGALRRLLRNDVSIDLITNRVWRLELFHEEVEKHPLESSVDWIGYVPIASDGLSTANGARGAFGNPSLELLKLIDDLWVREPFGLTVGSRYCDLERGSLLGRDLGLDHATIHLQLQFAEEAGRLELRLELAVPPPDNVRTHASLGSTN